MARTAKDRGRIPVCIEFDVHVLERLRADAAADQRAVAYWVRQIVNLHYAEIDDPGGKHFDPVLGRTSPSAKAPLDSRSMRERLSNVAKTAGPINTESGEDLK
jgi:hypothetical protein